MYNLKDFIFFENGLTSTTWKSNSGKSHILFSGNDNVSANIDNHSIISENTNELLGIIVDSKLSFEDHITSLEKQVKNSTH